MVLPGVDLVTLVGITLFAAIVNGALGYGFSSLTVPVALLFYSNRVLSPALVLVEVMLNGYTLLVNRKSVPETWRRVLPILCGLIPGIVAGSYILSRAHPEWLKLVTYVTLLPLILLQAAGVRRPIRAERTVGVPLGAGVGVLYSVTTISGPPLALMFNNQGFAKASFRAALGIIRSTESILTASAYYFLGLYTETSRQILFTILPSVVIGIPLGAYLISRMRSETFRRICMSFDAWVVGFGLSRALIGLELMASPTAYGVWLLVVLIDMWLLYLYFRDKMSFPFLFQAKEEV
ncbi:MAG: sulfite exporter TauE/SafE family protein [Candidatus Rokubacteria bacterium]|nr:sulfite exporter TauE/SafE family protein [Candidatus Rokubacteria bacterium]